MALTTTQMIAEVRDNIRRTSGQISDARILRWLNWGQEKAADSHTFEEMRKIYTGATVASSKRYGFPTRMKDIYSLRILDGANSRKLTYVNPRNFDTEVPQPTEWSTSWPDYYVDYGVIFELLPIPNSAYDMELRCSVYPEDMDETTQTSSDLLRKDRLLVAGGTIFGLWALKEYEEATFWGSEFWRPTLAEAVASDHSAEDWTPVARPFSAHGGSRVAGVGGSWWTNPFVGRI